jgi:predicted O-methyltransferase YrrM
MQDRMSQLEEIDAKDRVDGTSRMSRLRQIAPETGKFLSLLCASSPPGDILEIGTSAGYSTLWLALAARAVGRKVITFEILPEKIALAEETFDLAEVEDVVSLVPGDARDVLASFQQVGFCFLDAEKEVYGDCYELLVPNLVTGGLIVADNAINHEKTLKPMLERAQADERIDSLIVPIGFGELVCRKV